jgi:hypothetical protein
MQALIPSYILFANRISKKDFEESALLPLKKKLFIYQLRIEMRIHYISTGSTRPAPILYFAKYILLLSSSSLKNGLLFSILTAFDVKKRIMHIEYKTKCLILLLQIY